jgi:hypothetical protein
VTPRSSLKWNRSRLRTDADDPNAAADKLVRGRGNVMMTPPQSLYWVFVLSTLLAVVSGNFLQQSEVISQGKPVGFVFRGFSL